jgi:uncharacterized protein
VATLDARHQLLKDNLADMGSVLVACSGGVDSSLLLAVVCSVEGLGHLAVTTDSPTLPRTELEQARSVARLLGANHLVVEVNELATPGYSENPAHRCYLCKQTLYPLCRRLAEERGLAQVIDGVNMDDLGDYRPGLQAAQELGVRHPLVEAGLDKADVRALSRRYGLATAEQPASPCLSSRFPYGTRISIDRLRQVERAETLLHGMGFGDLRVRHLGESARVELNADDLYKLAEQALCDSIRSSLLELGFSAVELSEQPLRSGSLNDALAPNVEPNTAI